MQFTIKVLTLTDKVLTLTEIDYLTVLSQQTKQYVNVTLSPCCI